MTWTPAEQSEREAVRQAAFGNDDLGVLIEELKDHLSPHAMAAIVGLLQLSLGPQTDLVRKVEHELIGLRETMTEAMGGAESFNRLIDELGL